MKAIRIALTGLLLVLVGLAPLGRATPVARAATLVVDNTCICDDSSGLPAYCTIQAAVDAAVLYDTITVAGGTYAELVTIDKSLTLTAAPGTSPIIDGDVDGDTVPDGTVITIAADEVAIQGFEIRNGYNGIAGETSTSAITFNVIHDNQNVTGSDGVGILLQGANNQNAIADNVIFNNDRQGILLWGDSDENAIEGNEIYNNGQQGVLLGFSDDPKASMYTFCVPDETQIANDNLIGNNVIYDNGLEEAAYGVQLWKADGSIIEFNEIFGHEKGIYLTVSDGNAIYDNDVYGNSYGVALDSGSADTYLAGNIIHDNGISGLSILDLGSVSTLVNFNQFCRNGEYGLQQLAQGKGIPAVDATYNWWGSASGPGPVGPGTGDHVTAGVEFWPWDNSPPTDGPCHINSVHAQKYEDLDGDGARGEGESGLNGWTITLYDAEWNEVTSDTTHTVGQEPGWVLFEDVAPGDYFVCETPQDGWINTDPGSDPPCKPVTVTDDGRGPGSGPLFAFIDHPGAHEFRLSYLGLNLRGLDLDDPDDEELISRLSEPWLCLLGQLVVADPDLLIEEAGALDPRYLIEWDVSEGFDDGLYYLPVESDIFQCTIQLGVKTWRGSAGYSTATGFIECGGAPTVLFGNQEEPTAVSLASFTAQANAADVTVAWETGTEVDNAGFNLYRATAPDGPYAQINDALIAAKGDAVSGASYSFTDTPGPGTFFYKLEDVEYTGASTLHGPIQVTVAALVRRPLRRPTLPSGE